VQERQEWVVEVAVAGTFNSAHLASLDGRADLSFVRSRSLLISSTRPPTRPPRPTSSRGLCSAFTSVLSCTELRIDLFPLF
jgi:hypothetical protein